MQISCDWLVGSRWNVLYPAISRTWIVNHPALIIIHSLSKFDTLSPKLTKLIIYVVLLLSLSCSLWPYYTCSSGMHGGFKARFLLFIYLFANWQDWNLPYRMCNSAFYTQFILGILFWISASKRTIDFNFFFNCATSWYYFWLWATFYISSKAILGALLCSFFFFFFPGHVTGLFKAW